MRKMGGLYKKMPITYITFLIGGLALCAVPPFAGFFSKDTIIEAAGLSQIPGSQYAYFCVVLGAMVTALYTFRALFMTFHGKPRMDKHTWSHAHESPWSVCIPLIALAIPSVVLGFMLYMPMLFTQPSWLSKSLFILPEHNVLAEMAKEIISPWQAVRHVLSSLVFWLTIAAIVIAWIMYIAVPTIPAYLVRWLAWPYRVLMNKYGFDALNDALFVRGLKKLGQFFYHVGDQKLIDGLFVNGSGIAMRWISQKGRALQNGYLYHYVTVMFLGLLCFLCWLLLK